MKMVEEFAKKVMVENNSFDVTEEDRYGRKTTYHFMQDYIGKVRYVYGHHFWNVKINGGIELKYKLVAIVSNDVIYIVDKYIFGYLGDKTPELPKNVKLFDDAIKKANEYARNTIFPKYCDGLLRSDGITEEDKIGYDFDNQCLKEARKAIFNGESFVSIEPPETFLGEDDLGNILCGFDTLENVVLENLEKNRGTYERRKCKALKINELIKSGNVVKPFELEIANGLNGVSAKSVTVEFEVNGKTASGKMEPNTIDYILYRNDYIGNGNFTTWKRGEEIMKELGIKSYGEDHRRLYPSDIIKITYGKKVLYERKAV